MAAATAEEIAQLRAGLLRVSGELNDIRSRPAAPSGTGAAVDREKEMCQLLDSKILTKVDTFKGNDSDWLDWKFTMLTACGLVGLEAQMTRAEGATEAECLISSGGDD